MQTASLPRLSDALRLHEVTRMTASADLDEHVHASLDQLIRLQLQASGFSFLPNQPIYSQLAGRHESRLRGRGLDFDELRHYRPGDDIRNLDWKVTNRTGKPHVRCYREEREREVLLVVDQRLSMFFGSQVRMKSVVAAELAALACWRVLKAGDRSGALLFNDSEIVEFKPRRNRRSQLRMLGRLCDMNKALKAGSGVEPAPAMLNKALASAERIVNHDWLVVIISDLSGWDAQTVQRIKTMSRHNDVIAGFVFDPLEQELPAGDALVASDGIWQLQFDPGKADLRDRFAHGFRNTVDALRSELRKHAVPFVPVNTIDPVVNQLRQAIGEAVAR